MPFGSGTDSDYLFLTLSRLTAAGILDASGRALDGNDSGQPGGDCVALLTKGGAQLQVIKGAETFVRRPHRFPSRP